MKNNRAPLLCHIKLCALFHWQLWIQTGVTVWKQPLWPWPLTSDLDRLHGHHFCQWWKFHDDTMMKRCDRWTDRLYYDGKYKYILYFCKYIHQDKGYTGNGQTRWETGRMKTHQFLYQLWVGITSDIVHYAFGNQEGVNWSVRCKLGPNSIQVRYLMRGINGEKLGLKCFNVGKILTI